MSKLIAPDFLRHAEGIYYEVRYTYEEKIIKLIIHAQHYTTLNQDKLGANELFTRPSEELSKSYKEFLKSYIMLFESKKIEHINGMIEYLEKMISNIEKMIKVTEEFKAEDMRGILEKCIGRFNEILKELQELKIKIIS